MASRLSTKRLQIDKASSTIVVVVGISAFLIAFSLVSIKSLASRRSYQARVIIAQEKARDQLRSNIEAVEQLRVKYDEFAGRQENIIAGSSHGNGARDGDNARIVLDALPSKYDFPGLASSLEKVLVERNYKIQSIGGTDNEASINNGGSQSESAGVAESAAITTTGAATDMPFEVSAEGSYKGVIDLLGVFRRSIRPLHIQSVEFSAGDGNKVQVSIKGKSYFQPGKSLNITEEVVK